jgi:hypothetical protein
VTDEQLHDEELKALAQRLGSRAADRLDVERTSAAVLARLREPAETRVIRFPIGWLRMAAAVVLVIGAGTLVYSARRPHVAVPAAAAGVDLGDLSEDQLQEMLKAMDRPADDDAGAPDTGLDGLTAPELRSLLQSLEG